MKTTSVSYHKTQRDSEHKDYLKAPIL